MQLTILQWNVWFKENIERVAQELRRIDADVVCLQELTQGYVDQTHENTWEYIGHKLGYNYHVQEIPIVTADTQWLQGNAIFSRYPIESQMAAWIHEPAEDDDTNDQYRGYLEICIDVGGKRPTIATTHMSFAQPTDDDPELQRLLTLVESRPAPFILTGDLNATPDTKRIQEIAKRLKNVGPDFSQNTWTTKPYVFPTGPVSTLDWRYDYIFASQDVRVKSAKTLPTDISDHLPILATIKL